MAAPMKPADVAARWDCSAGHVRRLCRRGELQAMRLGSDWRISLEAVEAYEAAHTTASPAAAPVQQPVNQPSIRTVPFVVADGFEGALPARWWEQTATTAASPAAGRARSAGTKKRLSARN